MVLTAQHCLTHIEHSLGHPLAAELDPKSVVNQAGHWLFTVHPWKFLQQRSVGLDLRGKITVTDANWTEATKTLDVGSAGTFDDYVFVDGDQFEIKAADVASSTDVKQGVYEIASRPDGDSIVLKTSIQSSGGTASGVDGILELDSVALPSDFQQELDTTATESLVNGLELTTLADLNRLRTSTFEVTSSWQYRGAINWAGDPPVPIMEVWPVPQDALANAFTLFYRAGWVDCTTDTEVLGLPKAGWMDLLFIKACRIVALGYEEGEERENVEMEERLELLWSSKIGAAARRTDGMSQQTWGPMRGGGAKKYGRYGTRALLNSEVAAPSLT